MGYTTRTGSPIMRGFGRLDRRTEPPTGNDTSGISQVGVASEQGDTNPPFSCTFTTTCIR